MKVKRATHTHIIASGVVSIGVWLAFPNMYGPHTGTPLCVPGWALPGQLQLELYMGHCLTRTLVQRYCS